MTVEFKYLKLGALGGRGGCVRFFMLAHGIDFTEELYDMGTDWPAAKAKIIESGENPAGTVPVVKYDGKVLAQHFDVLLRHVLHKCFVVINPEHVRCHMGRIPR